VQATPPAPLLRRLLRLLLRSTLEAAAGDLSTESVLSHQVDVRLATQYDPFSRLASLWPHLKPAGRFVIYDEVIESLSHCHAKLCQGALGGSESAMNLILAETFFRNIQVLPNRTHPHVNMSASGGYILTGMKMNANK
jgi:tRNA A58 N-methylase Trm61